MGFGLFQFQCTSYVPEPCTNNCFKDKSDRDENSVCGKLNTAPPVVLQVKYKKNQEYWFTSAQRN